jgi:peptidoglycan/xylan/chitin deacetylase (PgdA/CDA1 family)
MRRELKTVLGSARSRRPGKGVVVLTYHRVGGGSPDERDVSVADFAAQVDALRGVDVVPLDTALDRLAHDTVPQGTVITIDDGFRDVYENAWPLLRRHRLPFTLYLTTAYVGGTMDWPGSTARASGPALTWGMVREMVDSGLCTLGNHTHTHVPATALSVDELDRCTSVVLDETGVEPRHFAYPWGIVAPDMEEQVARRFRSAVTGRVGRNGTGTDPWRLDRVPVRRTDPTSFFRAKLTGSLGPERAYAGVVRAAKAVKVRG